jgi:hypothetical protein
VLFIAIVLLRRHDRKDNDKEDARFDELTKAIEKQTEAILRAIQNRGVQNGQSKQRHK